jgi:hypothetical protein
MGRLLQSMMNGKNRVAEEGREMGHERVSKPTKMRAIAHFFGEDVCGIDLPSDVLDVERLILHPFANGIVAKLDMTCSFRSHVIRLLHAGLIIIVEDCWSVGVWNDVSSLRHAPGEIAKVYHLFGCGICSSNFSLARAQGSAFLSLAKPTERPPILENDAAIHAAEFEERKKSSVGNRAAKLGSPTCVAVCREGVGGAQGWRDSVVVRLNVGRRRVVNV